MDTKEDWEWEYHNLSKFCEDLELKLEKSEEREDVLVEALQQIADSYSWLIRRPDNDAHCCDIAYKALNKVRGMK